MGMLLSRSLPYFALFGRRNLGAVLDVISTVWEWHLVMAV